MFLQIRVYYVFLLIGVLNVIHLNATFGQEHAKNNGDIYVVSETKFMQDKITTEAMTGADDQVDSKNSNTNEFEAAMKQCNASFSIPMDYIVEFNTTGELPDIVDKTGMCYIRCFYEKSGLLENWKVNAEKIRQNIWPATGDSIEFCQGQGKREVNACVRAYAIAKCLMIRAIVDARMPTT